MNPIQRVWRGEERPWVVFWNWGIGSILGNGFLLWALYCLIDYMANFAATLVEIMAMTLCFLFAAYALCYIIFSTRYMIVSPYAKKFMVFIGYIFINLFMLLQLLILGYVSLRGLSYV